MSPTELREHCQKWEAIASSTKPADRKRVERRFKEIYTDLLKKGEPPPFFWAISPRDVRKITKPLHVTEGEKRYGTVFKTPGQIRRVVQAAIGKLPREPELEAAVNQIRHPLDLSRRRSWRLWSERPEIGEHSDIRREAFVDFFFSCGEWKGMLQSWLFVVASCNGLYMLERGIVFLDTPEIIRTDENGQLHCENGPAFRYRDGTEYHFFWLGPMRSV